MVSYIGKIIIIILLLLTLKFENVFSQELGNPISNLYNNEFSVNLYGEVVWRDMEDASYSSYRAITKVEYGFYEPLKIYGIFGLNKMFIDNSAISGLTDYKGKSEFAFGGGAQLEIYRIKRTSFFSGAGMFRTFSKGSVTITILDQEIQKDMNFVWKEYWFAFGAMQKMKRFDVYCGLEERTSKRFEKNSETEYISGFKSNVFVGIDLHLSNSIILSVQAKTLDQNTLTFGISQRSIGKLK
jgi:hypothetical protein